MIWEKPVRISVRHFCDKVKLRAPGFPVAVRHQDVGFAVSIEVAEAIAAHGLLDRVVRPGRVPDADRDGLIALAAARFPGELHHPLPRRADAKTGILQRQATNRDACCSPAS